MTDTKARKAAEIADAIDPFVTPLHVHEQFSNVVCDANGHSAFTAATWKQAQWLCDRLNTLPAVAKPEDARMPRVMYVCEECEEHTPESCGNFDPKLVRLAPDGRQLCEICYDESDERRDWPDWPNAPQVTALAPLPDMEDAQALMVRLALNAAVEALKPLASLELPKRPHGNAGAYSIRHSDIETAREIMRSAMKLLSAPPPASLPVTPDGWVLVPREPTEEMVEAAFNGGVPGDCDIPEDEAAALNRKIKASYADLYRAMLSSAPTPPVAAPTAAGDGWNAGIEAGNISQETFNEYERWFMDNRAEIVHMTAHDAGWAAYKAALRALTKPTSQEPRK